MFQNQETIHQKFQNPRQFDGYIKKLPDGLEKKARRFIQEKQEKSMVKQKPSGMEHPHKRHKLKKGEHLSKIQKATGKEQHKFLELVTQKYLSSLAQAGEPVGVIAAQSVGEPSTQMT